MRAQVSILFPLVLFLVGCKNSTTSPNCLDDLNAIKKEFLQSILQENVNESPFHIQYSLKTVLFSQDIVSLFGEIAVYDHLPHGWGRYEGKTFCKINGQFREIMLNELLPSSEQKEFLRKYCEDDLKRSYGELTYLVSMKEIYPILPLQLIRTFVVDEQFLIIIFQPYSVGGCGDGPFVVKIPYQSLEGHWSATNPLKNCLSRVIASQLYTSCWEEENFHVGTSLE
jgi:hypothetical protein